MSNTNDNWRGLLAQAADRLAKAGVASPEHDARALLAHHLNIPLNRLLPTMEDMVVAPNAFRKLVGRRARREPLAHITGQRGFWSLDLVITPDVLDPRPDTETLIEAILAKVPNRHATLKVLDIGTGSGAIALALLSELPNATAVASDVSPAALKIAKQNAVKNQLEDRAAFAQTEWAKGVAGPFDIIVSNPPYIRTDIIPTLEPEVKEHEPHLALDGGPDGLLAYRAILDDLPKPMASGTLIAFEIGFDQAGDVQTLMANAGLTGISICRDLGGKNRAVLGHHP